VPLTAEPTLSVLEELLHHCIRCGNCKYIFRDYSPSCPSGEKFRFESYFASGRIWLARGLMTGELEWDATLLDPIFACTTCGSCQEQCLSPHRDYIVDIIEELRRLAIERLGPLPAHRAFRESVERNHNPYGEPHHGRSLARQHRLPDKAETVYFVGCTSNYREKAIRDATISVLKKAGIDFTIVDEFCCGSPLLRTGQIGPVKDLAAHNREAFQRAGAERIVTSCAGCFRTLREDYERMSIDLDVEVVHTSQLVRDLLRENRLHVREELKGIVTYHDPCHLARHMGVYDAPREVLERIGLQLKEMRRSRENAWCCGSGGGVKAAYPDWSIEVASQRVEEALDTGAELLVSTCPFCKRGLRDGREATGRGPVVIDLVELVDRVT